MVTYKIGEQLEDKDSLNELVMDLLHSSIVTHIMHWQTESYAQHVALGEFYQTMPDLVDGVVEAYQGKNNVILSKFPIEMESYEDMTPLNYMEYLNQELYESRGLFGDDSEIQNLVDEIADLIDTTIYKLRRFK
jgi:DNA-binding ferritin-like protein